MNKRHEIERLAYELYQREGCTHGRDMEHWLEAERIVQCRHHEFDATDAAPIKMKASPKTSAKKVSARNAEKNLSLRKQQKPNHRTAEVVQ